MGEVGMSGMVGVIGGTGLYRMEGLSDARSVSVTTPFGPPSAPVVIGMIGGRQAAFLPRHGIEHAFLPSEINYRANIWALKSLGVTSIIGVSATGSLVQELPPGELVLPTQFLDMTRGKRSATFFGEGVIAHVSTADPVCPGLVTALCQAGQARAIRLPRDQVYACVEGPRFGTRAESLFLKSAGAHLVGMTAVPEAFLAREAQICYATLSVVTDYDCWHESDTEHANAELVLTHYRSSLGRVQAVLLATLEQYREQADCLCRRSLRHAVMTPDDRQSDAHREWLRVLRE